MLLVVTLASACSWSDLAPAAPPGSGIAAARAPAGRRGPAAPGRRRILGAIGQLLDAGEMYLVMMLASALQLVDLAQALDGEGRNY